ncbi:MAG: DUF4279 domain-containing protein [Methylacidiphilales bacterium]|nr:DUF4279 domain-containing protein [Candidatus Methylacidiphilales bacterium]
MARLHKSIVTLRIAGDLLVPDEITRLLGVSPTNSQTKGQELIGLKTGKVRIAKSGMWRLCASDREPEDMDDQINEILSRMTTDLAVWRNITERFEVDLFCGLFMGSGNEGLTISSQSLAALGMRGIEIGLDIYAGDDEQESIPAINKKETVTASKKGKHK